MSRVTMGTMAWLIALAGPSAVFLSAWATLHRTPAAIRGALQTMTVPGQTNAPRRPRLFDFIGQTSIGRHVARRLSSSRSFVRRLDLAGNPWSLQGAAGRTVLATSAASAATIISALAVGPLILLMPVAVLTGWRCPTFILARRARRRQQRIESQVPELVELLVAGSESGLPPPTAFIRSAEMLAAPLGDELGHACARIRLGQPWREALDETVARTSAPSLARLARSLERSHRLGAGVQGSLRALVEDVRARRRARAEEKARRAPVKMLFPLVFLILPAFLLLTVGPVLLSTVRSLH